MYLMNNVNKYKQRHGMLCQCGLCSGLQSTGPCDFERPFGTGERDQDICPRTEKIFQAMWDQSGLIS